MVLKNLPSVVVGIDGSRDSLAAVVVVDAVKDAITDGGSRIEVAVRR